MNADEQLVTYAGLVKAAMERPPLSQCLLFAGGVEERLPEPARTRVAALLPKTPVLRRAMTKDEAAAVRCIRAQVTFPVGHWDKRFMRQLPEDITEKQAAQVWRIYKTYRRQIQHERKAELLAMAERLAAPDLRKVAAAERAQREEMARIKKGVAS